MKKSKQLLPVEHCPCLGCLGKTEEAVSAYQELYEDLKDNPEFLEACLFVAWGWRCDEGVEVANQYLASYQTMQMQTLYDSL